MTEANYLKVSCVCGKVFRAPVSAAGKRARCPGCSTTLTIPAGPAASASIAPGARAAASGRAPIATPSRAIANSRAGATADPLDALDELARQEELAEPSQDIPRCGNCASPMPAGAVICTSCGFDARSGNRLAAPTAAAPKPAFSKGAAGVDRMAPQGSLLLGLLVSLLLAVIASVVWIALAYFTGFTIGYVAILIGIAAGVGMQLGHRGYSRLGGYAAAALTLVAILLAKLIVIEMLLSRAHIHKSISELNSAKLAYYFFNPIGLIIMVVGMAAAFRTANGSITE